MEKSQFFRGYFEIQMTPKNTPMERQDLVRLGSDFFSFIPVHPRFQMKLEKHYVQL